MVQVVVTAQPPSSASPVRALPLYEQCKALVDTNEAATQAIAAIKDKDLQKRIKAAEILANSCDSRATAPLLAAIKDEEINLHGLCPTLVSNYTLMEILFYNLRHLQHHAGQLNLLLRQQANIAADWISQADDPIHEAANGGATNI